MPAEFIPVAEETGLMPSLGEWVLLQACSRIADWNKSYGREIRVSVNVSLVQLQDNAFEQVIRSVLRITGLKPELLELELAEKNLMKLRGLVLKSLENLRDMGIRLSLDDFGSGYSSLSDLKRLPIRTLKLDKCFVHDIDLDPQGAEFTGAIIELIHKLKLEVIAEGVETESQLNCLSSYSCEGAQGYFLSRPAEACQAAETLQKNCSGYSCIRKGD